MRRRTLFVLGLVLAGCGGSGDSEAELAGANHLTAEKVAETGDYCCFQNGTPSADSAAACTTHAKSCVWSETYNDVDGAGRGSLCGYLICR